MAFCSNCGRELSESTRFCSHCGATQATGQVVVVPPGSSVVSYGPTRTDGMAIASLVLGIVGIVICPIVCSILAVIFGKKAKQRTEVNPMLGGRGLAQAGYILGWVGVALSVVWIFVVIQSFAGGDTSFVDVQPPDFQIPG